MNNLKKRAQGITGILVLVGILVIAFVALAASEEATSNETANDTIINDPINETIINETTTEIISYEKSGGSMSASANENSEGIQYSTQAISTIQPGIEGKDAYINSASATRNYGAATTIDLTTTDSKRGLIEFNFSSIPSGANVTNATIRLYLASKGTGASIPVTMQRVNSSWTEGTGDDQVTNNGTSWNSRNGSINWNSAGGDFGTIIWANTTVSTQDIFYTWDITSLVRNWVNGSYPNYGLILRAESGNGLWKFASSEDSNATRRPMINITYTESTAPVINSMSLSSNIRQGSNLGLTLNATDNSQVSGALININGVNYSLGQSSPTGSQVIKATPSAKGTIETNRIIDYQNAYDNNNGTKAGIKDNLLMTLKTAGASAAGTINSVKIKVIHSKATYNTTGYVHWAVSGAVQGATRSFNSTSESLTQSEFDVTSERNWSMADFNLLAEMHINNSDNILRVYETWFEINYSASSSTDIWNADINLSSLTEGTYNYTVYVNDSSNNWASSRGNFTILPKLVLVNATVGNASGGVQAAHIEIRSANNDIEYNETSNESILTSVEAGNKTIFVVPIGNPVDSLEFHDVSVSESISKIVTLGEPSESKTAMNQMYSIDPTNINFTSATIKVTAKGKKLFKCTVWNATSQKCEGRWKKLANIASGQEYNFTLTPEDPGFGESNDTIVTLNVLDYLIESNETIIANNSGIYDVMVLPLEEINDTFGKIVIYGFNESSGMNEIRINENASDSIFSNSYGIDPTNLSFANATIEKFSAKSTALYKCANWSFANETCLDNVWTFVKEIKEGENYNLTISNTDPGFTEQPNGIGKDTYIQSAYPSKNQGISTNLEVKSTTGDEKALIEFNISSIPSGAIITNATITLYRESGADNNPALMGIYRITSNWTEGTGDGATTNDGATWNTRNGSLAWNTAGGDYNGTAISSINVSGNGFYTWSITSLAQGWVNGSYPNYGVIFVYVNNGETRKVFSSSDNINATRRPMINITYQFASLSISIISPLNTTYNNRTQLVNISSTGNYTWFFNGTANETYTTPVYRTFNEGSNTIYAYANDSAGNLNSTGISFSVDTMPPAAITSLVNQSQAQTWIYWNWTNPGDADFSQAILYLNGINVANTSNNYYNATGLTNNTNYTLVAHTKDIHNNVNNSDVGSGAKTAYYNSLPAANLSLITPATAYTNDNLTCSFIVTDLDISDSLSVNYTWHNGTNSVISGTMGVINGTQYDITLDSGNTTKGEVWNCSVRPNDGNEYGSHASTTRTISNSLPTAPAVDILPSSPGDDDDIVASIISASSDADSDAITYSYAWYKNGALQAGLTTNTVSKVLTSSGENWSAVVTPNDGTGNGAAGNDSTTIITSSSSGALISLVSPSDGASWTSSNSVTFSYNTTATMDNCSLVIDNIIQQTDTNITANTTESFTQTLSNAVYSWKINCTNSSGNENSSASRTLTVSYTAPVEEEHHGGGGGGGSRIIPANNSNNIIQGNTTIEEKFEFGVPGITIYEISQIVANPGESKKISLNIKNTGTSYLNKCVLKGKEEYADWINSEQTNDLSIGQPAEYIFDLNIPGNAGAGKYNLSIVVECREISQEKTFNVEIIQKKLAITLLRTEKTEEGNLKVSYSLDELAREQQNVDVAIVILDAKNNRVAEIKEKRTIMPGSSNEFESFLKLPAETGGNLNLLINANSEIASAFVQEYVLVEGGKLSGFALFNIENKSYYLAGAVILGFVLFLVVVVGRILRYGQIYGRKHIISSISKQIMHGEHYHKD